MKNLPAEAGNSNTMKCYYVYILTNKNNRVLYVGFTDDIVRRISEHKIRFIVVLQNFIMCQS